MILVAASAVSAALGETANAPPPAASGTAPRRHPLLMGTSSNFDNVFSMAAAVVLLPFLPMLPVQILLNNFLSDLAPLTIPTDNVDPSFVVSRSAGMPA